MAHARWLGILLGGIWACNSGPISEFPFKGDDTSDESSAPRGGGSLADAGFAPPSISDPDVGAIDAGTTGPNPPTFAADAGAVAHPSPNDAGDASLSDACPALPVTGADDPQCAGHFCGVSRSELLAESVAGGACTEDTVALAAVCSGALPARAADCAQRELAAGSVPSSATLAACMAASDAALGGAACTGCFADEVRCALDACSAPFLSGDAAAAEQCRAIVCAPSFFLCSGLPISGF